MKFTPYNNKNNVRGLLKMFFINNKENILKLFRYHIIIIKIKLRHSYLQVLFLRVYNIIINKFPLDSIRNV